MYQFQGYSIITRKIKVESCKAAQRMEGARCIMDQIKSNTVARILEEEKKKAER